jgi:HEAT repeat protein
VAGDHVFVNVSHGYLVILRTLSGDADIKRAVRDHIRYLDKLAQARLVRIGATAVPDLTEAMRSEMPHVRASAAIVLGQIDPDPADVIPLAEALIETLKEPRSSARVYAAGALGGLKLAGPNATAATKALIELSREDHPTAAEALGRFGAHRENQAVVVPLLIAALKDRDWPVRWTAATALRQITPTEANSQATVAALTGALNDGNAKVRRAASLTLKTIDPEAVRKSESR